jgi:acyl transferase domain-containing protein
MIEPMDCNDIAVIGLSCRFPGDAKSPDEFFEMLVNARSAWTEVPKDRFDINSYWHPSHDRHGCMVGRGGHFLAEDVGLFDAPVSLNRHVQRNCLSLD